MATTGNDLDQAAARAARQAAREARAATNEQISALVTDIEALIAQLRDVADTELAVLRGRVEKAVAATKRALASQAQQAFMRSDRYVHSRPWEVAGIAAAGGLLFGALIAHQRRGVERAVGSRATRSARLH